MPHLGQTTERAMSELLSLLRGAVERRTGDDTVALLLSGGIDSASVGIALQECGKTVRAYTYRLRGYPSRDIEKAIKIANHFGWHLTVVEVPTADVASDFVRLAVEHRCRKKTQFENAFPLLYVLPRIEEIEVWTGWNADDHYGNTKKDVLHQERMIRAGASAVERKKEFDAARCAQFERKVTDPESGTWCYGRRLAEHFGKRLLDPYLDDALREFFLRFDHKTLSPLKKPLVRAELAEQLWGLSRGALTVGVRLQTGGSVDTLFETLLRDPAINRFETKYEKVAPLCQRWAREVAENPEPFRAELERLPPGSPAITISSDTARYRPYTMDDVRRASAARRFTVVSTFAGGGGSCIGFHLAGGHVALANEFVPEAARTYATNLPETLIDGRNIREINVDAATVEDLLARAGLRPGEFDILNGSPPCAEFSTAGRGLSNPGELRPYSDTYQRDMSTLILDFIRLAWHARPRVVVGENVPALAWSKNRAFFEGALDTLRFADPDHSHRLYFVNHTVLAASGFGVPQTRRRLFFVGIRADVARTVGIDDDDHVLALFPEPSVFPVGIRSALEGLVQTDADVRPWSRLAMSRSCAGWIGLLPRNPSRVLTLRDVGFQGTGNFSVMRCAWHLPAPTLTVTGQAPNRLSSALHPEEDRKFTIPELKRLFGLPDDYALTGTLRQGAERICRMVPPRVIQAIAERVYERVLRPYAEGRS
jgi:DNA (cytosine-5)-methyltransferase 1